jgi:hypothetical protein
MASYQRWTTVVPTEREEEVLDTHGSGMVARRGKDICLITQVNSDVLWAIEHRSGEVVTADTRGDGIKKAEELAAKYGVDVLSNDIGDYQTFELPYDKKAGRNFLKALSRI